MSNAKQNMITRLFQASEDTPLPIYARVKQAISGQIASGAWLPGQRIPSESEMVQAIGVSRMTVNRALRELTVEGILTRRQGVGTFVAEKKAHSALFEVHNIAVEIAARGHIHRAQLIELVRTKANMQEAMDLGVRANHSIFRSTILHFESEQPIQLEKRVVNASLAPDYDQHDFIHHTAYDHLMKVAPMTEGEHLVEAVLPTSQECELLNIVPQEPCLQIKRRTWSGQNVVTTARLLSPGSRFGLFGHFGR
jgi:GntR family histidine utilization transcriptional repressor